MINTKKGRRSEFLASINAGREFGSHLAAARGWVTGWRKSDWKDLTEAEGEKIDSQVKRYHRLVDEYHSDLKRRSAIEAECVGIVRGIYNVIVHKHKITD